MSLIVAWEHGGCSLPLSLEEGVGQGLILILRQGTAAGGQAGDCSPSPQVEQKFVSLGRGRGGFSPPKVGRNPFHLGKCSERTVGSAGNFCAYSPALFDISGRKFTALLNLTFDYARAYGHASYEKALNQTVMYKFLKNKVFSYRRVLSKFM